MRHPCKYRIKTSRIMAQAILVAVMAVTLLATAIPALGAIEENGANSISPANEGPVIGEGVANVAVSESDISGTTIDIQVPDLQEEEITVNGDTFKVLTVAGYGYTEEVGKPQMPVIRETIGIPDGASVTATITDSSYATYDGYKVYPVQQPETDSEEDGEFAIDEEFYTRDAFYPQELLEVGAPAIWRDVAVVSLRVNPVQYNPATGELRVYHNIKVNLEYSGGTAIAKTVSPMFGRIYRSSILNYDYLDITEKHLDMEDIPAAKDAIQLPDNVELDTPVSTTIKLLSIRPSSSIPFANIKPLLDWHKKRGLPYLSGVVTEPTTVDSVKNMISTVYASHPELEYVLLVGDIDIIPWQTDWDGYPGDHWYACITGGSTPDVYPDVAVGRLTVNNTTELQTQIDKIITYSDSPPVSAWVDRVLLVAHYQEAPYNYQGCKEDIRTATYTDGFTFDTAYGAASGYPTYGDDATNADVNNAINNGRGIVNYRGHGAFGDDCPQPWGQFWGAQDSYCNSYGWNTSNQRYMPANAHALANGDMTPVIFNIACMNGALDSTGECLGEAFVKDTDSAVAFLGATRPSWRAENHEFDQFLFDAIGNEGIYNLGWVINDAKTELIDIHGDPSYAGDNVRMYLLLGDPALELWSVTPKTLTVTYPDTVQNSIMVTVREGATAVPSARVTLTKGDPNSPDIYTYAYTDALGQASISFSASEDGPMNVSVTKHNYLPHTGTVTVDTTVPVVTVTAPNGGEAWGAGEVHDITWTATDAVEYISIRYSVDGGASFPYIAASGLSNTGGYAWTVPHKPSSSCRVKVMAIDEGGLIGEDISDADFSIISPDIQVRPPSFDIALPPDVTWQSKLKMNNYGTQELTYNIVDVETTGGPYFKWAKQTPYPLPAGGKGCVEAMVNDPDGLGDITYVKLSVLVNLTGDWAYMKDDGVAPDEKAGDGIYTLTIYGATGYGEEVILLLEAKDTASNSGYVTYPLIIDIPDGAPADSEPYLCGAPPEAAVEIAVTPDVEPYVISQDENSGLAGDLKASGGNVVKTLAEGIDANINAAILASYNGSIPNETNACVDMANTLIANGINADVVRYNEIDTMAEINNYDVVIIGSCGSSWSDAASGYGIVQDEVRSFVEDYGKGLVGVGGTVWNASNNNYTDYDAVFPVDILTPYGYLWGYNVSITGPPHTITDGLGDFGLAEDNLGEWAPGGMKPGAYALGLYDENGEEAIVAWNANGNVAYLGPYYLASENEYNTANLYQNSYTVQLLVNAVRWAAAGVTDCPWLDENPDNGSVATGYYAETDVTIDTTGLAVGEYSAEIYVASNDTNENPTIVPVQLTVSPAIEAGAILFDETHDPYFTTSYYYQEWVAWLELWGFMVNTETTGPITYELLANYCAVVISNPMVDYTDAEIEAIAAYINDGGGLLILGENGNATQLYGHLPILNELAAPFGMSFNSDMVRDDENHDGYNNAWPLIPDFDASVAGADVDTAVYYAGCTVNAEGAAFPVAWAYDTAYMDMDTDALLDALGVETGEPAPNPVQKQAVKTEVPEGIDAVTGEEPVSEPATVSLTPLKDTDAGGKVLWDLTHGVWGGYEPSKDFSMLVEVLTEKGYTVETTSDGILSVNLEEYAVLVISVASAWYSAYTPEEVEAISNFVHNGGGLLVMGENTDCPNENINPVAQAFGTTCGISDITPYDLYVSDLAAHPIFDGVTQFFMRAAGEIDGSTPPSQEVAWDDTGLPVVSVATGSGRVVVTGNVDQWVNDNLPDVNNQLFAENVFDWLSTPPVQPVVMAASHSGSGRAMVIGDGNLFTGEDVDGDGVLALYEYDNERLALNIIDWLCQAAPGKPDLVVVEKIEKLAMPQKYLHPTKPLDPMEPITNPVDTSWHELYPVYCNGYDLLAWEDNGDEVLSFCDWILLQDIKTEEERWYHVDRMTVTLFIADNTIAFEFVGGAEYAAWAMANPTLAFWHLVYPEFCHDFGITEWKDVDENGLLSAGDVLTMVHVAPGGPSIEDTTVSEVSWDIIVSPPPETTDKTYYKVQYTLLNQGTATAPRGHSTTLYVDGAEVEHQVCGGAPLEPGQTWSNTFRTVIECTGEEDIVIVEADNYNQVDEENEENNRMENKWSCCRPSIEVIKKVWSPRTEQWVEQICAQVEQMVRFQCTIHNNGECCDLSNITVGDILSDSLKYANNATVNGEPWEPDEVGPNEYQWDFGEWVLRPSERIVIEFNAVVVKWTAEPDVNLQWARAYCPHPEGWVHAEDTAAVQPFICGDVNMDAKVNMADVMILWYDIAEYPYEGAWIVSNECAADVNCDGKINMADVMILWYDIAEYPSAGAWVVSCCE